MQVTNLLKTTLTCTAYALVIGKNSEDVWKAFGVEKLWFMGHRCWVARCYLAWPMGWQRFA